MLKLDPDEVSRMLQLRQLVAEADYPTLLAVPNELFWTWVRVSMQYEHLGIPSRFCAKNGRGLLYKGVDIYPDA